MMKQKVNDFAIAKTNCSKCGSEMKENARLCFHCGNDVRSKTLIQKIKWLVHWVLIFPISIVVCFSVYDAVGGRMFGYWISLLTFIGIMYVARFLLSEEED